MNLVVTNTVALTAAIKVASAGDTIQLAAGHYDSLALSNVQTPGNITITSQDAQNRAVVDGISLSSTSGLTFQNLDVNIHNNVGVYMISSSNVTLEGLNVKGISGTTGLGPGVALRDSNHIQVLNSDISALGSGISDVNNDTVLLKGNVIHDVTSDGIDNIGTSNLVISNNKFTDFHTEPGAHPDAIQFFTTWQVGSAHDITITGNVFTRGAGDIAQGIFMGNEWSLPYKNVVITDNAIVGGMYNGIYVEDAVNITINHNLVDGYSDYTSWIYLHGSTGSVIQNNSANSYIVGDPNGETKDNSLVGQTAVGDSSSLQKWLSGTLTSTPVGPQTAATGSGSTTASAATGSGSTTASAATGSGSTTASNVSAGETLTSNAGDVTLRGGVGNDSIVASSGHNYLRGGDGDDQIVGGTGFDDINGNAGNDTISAGAGDDWVLGGQGNDKLLAGEGDDLVYGNLGNDTLDGGTGADTLRGGQGDDSMAGGAGNDWLSGDLGNDTMTGGAGADIFHTFVGTGIDVVTDFNIADGDRVMVDPGTTYSLSQVGADVIIKLGTAGDELIMQGIKLSQLTTGWIFGA